MRPCFAYQTPIIKHLKNKFFILENIFYNKSKYFMNGDDEGSAWCMPSSLSATVLSMCSWNRSSVLIFFCPWFESHHFLLLLNSLFLKSLYFLGYRFKNDKRSTFGTKRFDEYKDGSTY